MSKLTVESIMGIYGGSVKEVKVFNEKKRAQAENFLQIEPVAFALSDEPDVLRIYIDKESAKASCEGTLQDDEQTATEYTQQIIEEIGEDAAGALVEYANMVKQLAEDLTDEQLEDSNYIKSLLQEQLPNWDWEDWYDLLIAVKREKRAAEHEEKTAQALYIEMPYFAQRAAEVAVKNIIQAAKTRDLFHAEKASTQQVEILWTMFYCCGADIKKAAENINKKIETQGYTWGEGLLLLNFLEELRAVEWQHGEVTQLRTKELK